LGGVGATGIYTKPKSYCIRSFLSVFFAKGHAGNRNLPFNGKKFSFCFEFLPKAKYRGLGVANVVLSKIK
jgi:hypothetical protein